MSTKDSIHKPRDLLTATIANGTALTQALDAGGLTPMGVSIPAAWDAASLTVLVSSDLGVTYQPMYDGQGNEYTIAAAAGQYILLDAAVFGVIRRFQLRSGTNAAPVNQTAARSLVVHLG